MALFLRILKSSEGRVLKNCSFTLKTNWNAECTFSVRKVDIPAPPKRPLSAYMIFCKENRQNVLKEDPTLTSAQQIKKLAAKWNELQSDMKEPYEISARQSTVDYGEAHKKFYESLTEDQKEELARLKKDKKESRRKLKLNRILQESGMPKPASSAYALFVKAEAKNKKAKGEIHKPTEFLKTTAEKWNKLSPEVKQKFEKEAELDKKRFESEMKTWKQMLESEGNIKLLQQYEETLRSKSKKRSPLQETLL